MMKKVENKSVFTSWNQSSSTSVNMYSDVLLKNSVRSELCNKNKKSKCMNNVPSNPKFNQKVKKDPLISFTSSRNNSFKE